MQDQLMHPAQNVLELIPLTVEMRDVLGDGVEPAVQACNVGT
jgi:hypothetical protein